MSHVKNYKIVHEVLYNKIQRHHKNIVYSPQGICKKKKNSTTSPSIAIFSKLLTVSVYKIKKKQGVKKNLTTFENDKKIQHVKGK